MNISTVSAPLGLWSYSMAQRSKATFQKREREKALQQKQRDKDARRLEAKQRKADQDPSLSNEDPDIAGIKPGPQPLPEQWQWTGDDDK
jgi:hypothetical protein